MIKKISLFLLSTSFLFAMTSCGASKNMDEKIVYQGNKTIPKEIFEEAKTALSYYPQLKDVPIEFRFKDDIKKSFMQAQPDFGNLFKGKKNRSYNIYISSRFKIEGEEFSMDDIPSDVLIGWLGHELGHVMDYRNKTAMGLVIFGVRYVTSSNYIKRAEKAADVFAVNHGMADYILSTKDFILNNSSLSDEYKERIARLYLSPEEIVVLVDEMEEKEAEEALEEAAAFEEPLIEETVLTDKSS